MQKSIHIYQNSYIREKSDIVGFIEKSLLYKTLSSVPQIQTNWMNKSWVNIVYDIPIKKSDTFCFYNKYFYYNIVISQWNSKSFFTEMISGKSSTKSDGKENFLNIFCWFFWLTSHGTTCYIEYENLCISILPMHFTTSFS